MTADRWQKIDAALDDVLERPVAERATALDRWCAGDGELRAEIERLLAADEAAGAFLEPPIALFDGLPGEAEEDAAPRAHAPLAFTGVERYRIVREIGRGGMGTVFLAERADGAFDQQVALKIVHAGAQSEEERRRFLQERQILATLDHPNIARVFDGGMTDDGRPYFAMEYVEGTPITTDCAARALGCDRRLRLFLDVCVAVEVAHRHLIVHRDLKPSNILVTRDGRVKLVDFGIAKPLAPEVAGAFPQTVGHVLTPEYAAPEQIRGGAITMATDVYGLGAVLYELLTGRRPHARSTPLKLPFAILDEEPPKPSSAVSEADTAAAAAVGMPAPRLRRRLRGDLDTIVMTALRKEPGRRYQSAEALRDDLERFLGHLPIRARPDSATYRARRFVRRHAVASSAALLVMASLAAGLAGTIWQARAAARQARRAEAAQAFMASVFRLSDPNETVGRTVTAREILDLASRRIDAELAATPEIQADMLTLIGRIYTQLGLYREAKAPLERGLAVRERLYRQERAEIGESLDALGVLAIREGRPADAERTLGAARDVCERTSGRDSAAVATVMSHLAEAAVQTADFAGAEAAAARALAIRKRLFGDRAPAVAEDLILLARARRGRGEVAGAAALDQEALDILRGHFGANHPDVVRALASVALDALERGRYQDAEDLYREALAGAKRTLGADHPDTLQLLSELARVLGREGKLVAAEVLLREALEAKQWRVGERHPSLVANLTALAWTVRQLGRRDEAERFYRDALAIAEQQLGADHVETANARDALASLLREKGQ